MIIMGTESLEYHNSQPTLWQYGIGTSTKTSTGIANLSCKTTHHNLFPCLPFGKLPFFSFHYQNNKKINLEPSMVLSINKAPLQVS